jgi:hypothetical protein
MESRSGITEVQRALPSVMATTSHAGPFPGAPPGSDAWEVPILDAPATGEPRLGRGLFRVAERPSPHMVERLSAAILEQEERLAGLAAGSTSAAGDGACPLHLHGVLRRARELCQAGRVLEGWQEVYEARLAMIGLYPPEDCLAYRVALREEARAALSGTRLRAAERLLAGQPRTLKEAADARARGQLRMVRRIIDGHWQGVYMRAAHTRTQLFFLPIVLGVILAALFAASMAAPDPLPGPTGNILGSTALVVWIYVCGALGALLSVTLGTIRGVTRRNYLLVSEFRVNLTRPLLGAASAAAVVAILSTSLFNVGDDPTDRPFILAAAIVAGFSERLLTNAIAAVVHGKPEE